jgi:hypothetical protein
MDGFDVEFEKETMGSMMMMAVVRDARSKVT